jgi:predicted O-methyltransferase YrrM
MPSIALSAERFVRGVRFRLTRRLRDRHPSDVWPGIETVAVRQRPFAARFGSLAPHELALLCAVARLTRPRAVFEFGTFDGLTTWHLAANAGAQTRVWTLDLPPDHPARSAAGHNRAVGKIQGVPLGGHFADTPEGDRITQLYGDSLEFDAAPYRRAMDFILVDAGHGYEHVRSDTANALTMVRPGGVVFWHDYSRWWPGVQRVLDVLARSRPVFRVAGTSLAALVVSGPDPRGNRH